MNEVTKANISGAVQVAGVVLAAPFVAVGLAVLLPLLALADKIHSCRYGESQYDPQLDERYRLCVTCKGRIVEGDDDESY